MTRSSCPVIHVIGGGWAGLAAALELQTHGCQVHLLESSAQFGGRARSIQHNRHGLDNGQHLLLGAYHETLRLLDMAGVPPDGSWLRTPLQLTVHGRDRTLSLTAPILPAPLHLAFALFTAKGLHWHERIAALRFSLKQQLAGFHLAEDISVRELLLRHGQDSGLIRDLWEPLCLAALNTPIEQASATLFLKVLEDSFTHSHKDADLVIPAGDLGRLFVDPLVTALGRLGAGLQATTRVDQLRMDGQRISAVRANGQWQSVEHVILATPRHITVRLLQSHAVLQPIERNLSRMQDAPIATVYLQYDENTQLDPLMQGMTGTLSQWIFDRRVCGQAGLMAVVVSGPGAHERLSRESLANQVAEELAEQFPHWPKVLWHYVIREKRATFLCVPGVNALRPDNRTPLHNLWLAGDFTATDYPATLEGAVRSGVQCARRIIGQMNS